jgi:hypothetical protein
MEEGTFSSATASVLAKIATNEIAIQRAADGFQPRNKHRIGRLLKTSAE